MATFDFNPRALDAMLRQDRGWIQRVGNIVRDEARDNVVGLPSLAGARTAKPEGAIIAVVGEDSESIYVDVGYDAKHPGFYLWWWEVGTRYHAPLPHLRPAVRDGILPG